MLPELIGLAALGLAARGDGGSTEPQKKTKVLLVFVPTHPTNEFSDPYINGEPVSFVILFLEERDIDLLKEYASLLKGRGNRVRFIHLNWPVYVKIFDDEIWEKLFDLYRLPGVAEIHATLASIMRPSTRSDVTTLLLDKDRQEIRELIKRAPHDYRSNLVYSPPIESDDYNRGGEFWLEWEEPMETAVCSLSEVLDAWAKAESGAIPFVMGRF